MQGLGWALGRGGKAETASWVCLPEERTVMEFSGALLICKVFDSDHALYKRVKTKL